MDTISNRMYFNKLSVNGKLDWIVSFGKVIDNFESNDLEITTYQMDGFVVDVQLEKITKRLIKIVS